MSLCIQSKCGKIRTRKTPNTDTFYAEPFLRRFCLKKMLLCLKYFALLQTNRIQTFLLMQTSIKHCALFFSQFTAHHGTAPARTAVRKLSKSLGGM